MKLTGRREKKWKNKKEKEMKIRISFLKCSVDFVQNVMSFVSDASGTEYIHTTRSSITAGLTDRPAASLSVFLFVLHAMRL